MTLSATLAGRLPLNVRGYRRVKRVRIDKGAQPHSRAQGSGSDVLPAATPEDEERRAARFADEAAVVDAVRAGDQSAFSRLVERYMDPGYAVALSILRQQQDAEDALQSAFIRALERIDQLRPGSPFGPWFYRVLRSTCLNLLRREALRDHDPLPRSASGSTNPQRELERRLARESVLAALAQLPEMQRLAVTLYDLEGYSHQQVAEILDIAEGTSRAHVHHGRRALRAILGPETEKGT